MAPSLQGAAATLRKIKKSRKEQTGNHFKSVRIRLMCGYESTIRQAWASQIRTKATAAEAGS